MCSSDLTGTVTRSGHLQCCGTARCNLIPLTGTVTFASTLHRCSISDDATLFLLRLADFCRAPARCLQKVGALRQPCLRCFVHWTRSPRLPLTGTVTRLSMLLATVPRMQPYTPHGDSNGHRWLLSSCQRTRCNLIPLTGTVTISSIVHAIERMPMQPYTPHGDSNSSTTAPPMVRSDATLYPSRGQ